MAGMALVVALPSLARVASLRELVNEAGHQSVVFTNNARLLASRVDDICDYVDSVKAGLQEGYCQLVCAPVDVLGYVEQLGRALVSCHDLLLKCRGASKLYMVYRMNEQLSSFKKATDDLVTGLDQCSRILRSPEDCRKKSLWLRKKLKSGIAVDKEEVKAHKEIMSILEQPRKSGQQTERLFKRLKLDSREARDLEIKALQMELQLGSVKQDLCERFLYLIEQANNKAGMEYGVMDPKLEMTTSREHHVSPPAEFECPLSRRVMIDPVVIASGKTYERAYISEWLAKGKKVCPRTRNKLPHFMVTPHFELKARIRAWFQENWLAMPGTPDPDEVNRHIDWLIQNGVDVHGLSVLFRKPGAEPREAPYESGNGMKVSGRDVALHPRMVVAPVRTEDVPRSWRNASGHNDAYPRLIDREVGRERSAVNSPRMQSQAPEADPWPEGENRRGREYIIGSRGAVPEGSIPGQRLMWRGRTARSDASDASVETEQEIERGGIAEDGRQGHAAGSSDTSNSSAESNGARYQKQRAYAGVKERPDSDGSSHDWRSARTQARGDSAAHRHPRSDMAMAEKSLARMPNSPDQSGRRAQWSSQGVPKLSRGGEHDQMHYAAEQSTERAELASPRLGGRGQVPMGYFVDQPASTRFGKEGRDRAEPVFGSRFVEKQSRGSVAEARSEPRAADVWQRDSRGSSESVGREHSGAWETNPPADSRALPPGRQPVSSNGDEVIYVEGYGYLRNPGKVSKPLESVGRSGSGEVVMDEQPMVSADRKPVFPGQAGQQLSDQHGAIMPGHRASGSIVQECGGFEQPQSLDVDSQLPFSGDVEVEDDDKPGDTYVYAFGDDEYSESFTQPSFVPPMPGLGVAQGIPIMATGYPPMPLPYPSAPSSQKGVSRLRPPPPAPKYGSHDDLQSPGFRPEQGDVLPVAKDGGSRESSALPSPSKSEGAYRQQGHGIVMQVGPSTEDQARHVRGASRGTPRDSPRTEESGAFGTATAAIAKRPQTAPAAHGVYVPSAGQEGQSPKQRAPLHDRSGSGDPCLDPMSPRQRVKPMSIVTMPPEKAPLYKPRVLNLEGHTPHVTLRGFERDGSGGAERPVHVHLGGHIERARELRQMFPYGPKNPNTEPGKGRQGYGFLHGGVVLPSDNHRERSVDQRVAANMMPHGFPSKGEIDAVAAAMREMSRRGAAERNTAAAIGEANSGRDWDSQAMGGGGGRVGQRTEPPMESTERLAVQDVGPPKALNCMPIRPDSRLEGPQFPKEPNSTIVDSMIVDSIIVPVATPFTHDPEESPTASRDDVSVSDDQSNERVDHSDKAEEDVDGNDKEGKREEEEIQGSYRPIRHGDQSCGHGSEERDMSETAGSKAAGKHPAGEDVSGQGVEIAERQGWEAAPQGSEDEEGEVVGDSDAYGSLAKQLASMMVHGSCDAFDDTVIFMPTADDLRAQKPQHRGQRSDALQFAVGGGRLPSALQTAEEHKGSEAARRNGAWEGKGSDVASHSYKGPGLERNHNRAISSDAVKMLSGLAVAASSVVREGVEEKVVQRDERRELEAENSDSLTREHMRRNAMGHGGKGQWALEKAVAEEEEEHEDDANSLQDKRRAARLELPSLWDKRGSEGEGASCNASGLPSNAKVASKVVSFVDLVTENVDVTRHLPVDECGDVTTNVERSLEGKGSQQQVQVGDWTGIVSGGPNARVEDDACESTTSKASAGDLGSGGVAANVVASGKGENTAEVYCHPNDKADVSEEHKMSADALYSQVRSEKDVEKKSRDGSVDEESHQENTHLDGNGNSGGGAVRNSSVIPDDRRMNRDGAAAAPELASVPAAQQGHAAPTVGSHSSAGLDAPDRSVHQRHGSLNGNQTPGSRPVPLQQSGIPAVPWKPAPASVRSKNPAPLYRPTTNRLAFLIPDGRRSDGYSGSGDSPASVTPGSPFTPSESYMRPGSEDLRVPDRGEVQVLINRLTSGRADLGQKLAAVRALRKMTKDIAQTRTMVGESGGIEALGALLDRAQEREKLTFTSTTTDWNTDKDWNELVENIEATLLNVSIEAGYKSRIARGSGAQHLVRLMTEARTEGIRDMAVAALYSLSFDEESQIVIGEVNGIRALVELLGSDEASLAAKKDALKTLSKLSYKHLNRQRMLVADVVRLALEFAQHVGSALSAKALSVVNNLMAIPEGRIKVAEAGGIKILASVIQRRESEALIEYAVAILYYVATGSAELQVEVASVPGIVEMVKRVISDPLCTPRGKDKAEKLLNLPCLSQVSQQGKKQDMDFFGRGSAGISEDRDR
ncbi:hypothetical protein CBR_g17889 [Chara braunii]|uniref:RING-type E3 ubiquitin transferase n=1 Tax=Chara braunii TaxID=69332 RepID=A0A388KVT3_CHABU|nr:hypothetical protein CBR_g17889 [Chara braunii]|eukprot:GBG74175.1 hypothetical protein CBR_g17889 [Chara braunii]